MWDSLSHLDDLLLRGHEGERNNCFNKIQLVGPKISRLNIFRKLKLDINPLLPPKHCKYGGAFRYSWAITYSLLVAQPIRTQHW